MALNPDFQAALASIIRPIYATDLPDNLEAMRHWLSGLGLATPTYPLLLWLARLARAAQRWRWRGTLRGLANGSVYTLARTCTAFESVFKLTA